jgi:hypothetical protein
MTTSPFYDFEMGDGLRGVACCRKTRGSRLRERTGGSVPEVLVNLISGHREGVKDEVAGVLFS